MILGSTSEDYIILGDKAYAFIWRQSEDPIRLWSYERAAGKMTFQRLENGVAMSDFFSLPAIPARVPVRELPLLPTFWFDGWIPGADCGACGNSGTIEIKVLEDFSDIHHGLPDWRVVKRRTYCPCPYGLERSERDMDKL